MDEPFVPRTEPPTAQETLDAIEEVKEIAGKYGHEDNFLLAKPELLSVAKKLQVPVSISESNSFPTDIPEHEIKQRETRQRTITLGKKGSGLEQIFSVPPYNPHANNTSKVDLKNLI